MKKQKITLIFILILFILLAGFPVFASDTAGSLSRIEYTEEFQEWLELSDEERENTLQPKPYKITDTETQYKSPFYLVRNLRASLSSRYSLKDIIPDNIVIKNQQDTNSCWAFASLVPLETNLALLDYRNGASPKIYDYSERHLEYSTSRIFKNNEENTKGYNRNVGSGGNWYLASSYLTNGSGAIAEAEMPFENNENLIELSQIQNKTVSSQVYDTKDFSLSNISDYKSAIKEHIQNYGAVYAGIHGANLSDGSYNNDTGAIYCNSSTTYPMDHAVAIIGWDDNYSVDNFNSDLKPTSNGAWIIKNSWGDIIEYDLQELKNEIFETYEQQCIERGWNTATEIPDSFIESAGYTIENNKAYMKIGDNGLMYVSYEDANIYSNLYGIIKAANTVDYENIYQYNEYFAMQAINFLTQKIMLCNIFDKQTTGNEYLTQISLYAPETYTCRVYVNPNGTSKARADLQLVTLKEGEIETFDAGYHTIEFSEPIKINANNFVVVVEIQGTRSESVAVPLESKVSGLSTFDVVEVETGKCFVAAGNDLENCEWVDLGKLTQSNPSLFDGDSTIKAFTTSKVDAVSLESIEITTPPTKTKYIEGENFDKSGMVVKANYSNGESKIITDYNISNGTNLQINQTSVVISYEDKTVTQAITVEKAKTEELEKPDNTEDDNINKPVVEESTPENSNFDNAYCDVTYIKIPTSEENCILEIIVNGIIKSTKNDSYEYYYYLSPNQDEENIEDWVKITESQTANNKLEFDINTEDLKNYAEILASNTLYLYIKEVAISGGNQAVIVSKPMKIEYTKDTQVNNINIDTNEVNSSKVVNGENTNYDNTTSSGTLPQTGVYIIFIIVAIAIITILVVILYKRYAVYKDVK